MCAAPKGNAFWKQRSKHGRDKLFATPELLLEAAQEYFEWCDENPWLITKSGNTPKGPTSEEKPTQRPYSISGFLLYIDASESYWRTFKKAGHKDFLSVISRIEKTIETQQMDGAMVGAFNANIVARKLALVDKTEIDHTTKGDKIKEIWK